MKQYDIVIGLEVHVELATKTKIFCACPTAFGGRPNAHTCPVCTGMPGTLPVLNKQVVEYAIAVGLALNCQITNYCKFDRKNYFYPDNPQNYQISQLYLPICRDGRIEIQTDNETKQVGIHEIHMEEDAGKLVHDELGKSSWIDYNRAGVPLIEIVTEPDLHSADEVIECLSSLRAVIQYLGASDCKLQEGSMRVDVNLSVKEKGAKELGTRTEMKNLNSFKAIRRAILAESDRQIKLLLEGQKIVQETRRWDDAKELSYSLRSKEEVQDYRYFPEPDLVPLAISAEWIANIQKMQPELQAQKRKRYQKEYDIPEYDARFLTATKSMAEMFEAASAISQKPKKVSNWLMVETIRLQKRYQKEIDELPFAAENLAKLVLLTEVGIINSTVAKDVFEEIFKHNINPEEYIKQQGLNIVADEEKLRPVVAQIIKENPQSVADYKNGKERAIGFLTGQAMKATAGKANPKVVNKLLKELL